jgi:hypothetical protein
MWGQDGLLLLHRHMPWAQIHAAPYDRYTGIRAIYRAQRDSEHAQCCRAWNGDGRSLQCHSPVPF